MSSQSEKFHSPLARGFSRGTHTLSQGGWFQFFYLIPGVGGGGVREDRETGRAVVISVRQKKTVFALKIWVGSGSGSKMGPKGGYLINLNYLRIR